MRTAALLIFCVMSGLMFGQADQGTIEVTGVASVEVEPDYLDIQIVIEQQGDDAAEIQNYLMEKARKILAYLAEYKGVARVKTEQVTLYPRQDYQTKKMTYSAREMVSFRITDLAVYEDLMPGLLELGVSGISRSQFGSSEARDLEAKLMQQALQNAMEKATMMANTLGREVGKAVFISDQQGGGGGPYPMADMKLSSTAPSIEGGSMVLQQSVRVHFQLN